MSRDSAKKHRSFKAKYELPYTLLVDKDAQIAATRAVTLTGAWRWVDPVRDPFDFIDAEGNVLLGDTPGYAALDVGANVSLRAWMPAMATLRVMNALDRDYSEVKGFPAPGRAVTAGLTVGSW